MNFTSPLRTGAIVLSLLAGSASASPLSSASYRIDWDVADSGGGTAMSASYSLNDSVAPGTALGESTSASYRMQPGFLSPPDFDTDGVRNFLDNCTQDANPDQRDSNSDGYGNVCDADLNNDGITNTVDLGLLRLSFFTADADADLNGDGVVNVVDLGTLRAAFFSTPGSANWNPDADFNGDGVVNVQDLGIMRAGFFAPPGPSAQPGACENRAPRGWDL